MSHPTDHQIDIFVPSETDVLQTVLMRLVAPMQLLKSWRPLREPSIRRQLRHNRFVPYKWHRALAQQLEFKNTLEAHGVRVILEPPIRYSGAHYTRDVGFAIDDTFFVARMGTRARQPEVVAMEPWLARFSKVIRLDAGTIEGGDVMLAPGRVLVGLGEATNEVGVASLTSALARAGSARDVVPLRFNSPGVIHLDTKFNLVSPELAVISRHSFEEKSLKWLEQNYRLIDATPEETRAIHINTFGIGNGAVVMDTRAERLASELRNNGVSPILLDYSEITRLPGSFRCTTLPLHRTAKSGR
ncbi:MAG: dimethylarginine dimethylaminohydrolase family protein [Nocardioides sp.]